VKKAWSVVAAGLILLLGVLLSGCTSEGVEVGTVEGKRIDVDVHQDSMRVAYLIRVNGRDFEVSWAAYSLFNYGDGASILYEDGPFGRPRAVYVAYGTAELREVAGEDEITVAVALAPSEREVFEQVIIPEFEKETGLGVRLVQVEPGFLIEILDKELGEPFDLIAVDVNSLAELVEKGLVQDLSGESHRVPEQALPLLKEVSTLDGRLYFFPFRPNVQITYYDTDRFDDIGVEPPHTWDEIEKVARAFVAEGYLQPVILKAHRGGAVATQLTEFICQAGGSPLELNGEGSKEAFRFLQRLYPYIDSRGSSKARFDTVNDYLRSGEVAWAQNWAFGVREVVVEGGKDNIHAYSGWAGPAGECRVLGGDVLGIPVNDAKPVNAVKVDNAYRFAEFLMSRHVQSTLANSLFWPPMRTDSYEDLDPDSRPYWDAIDEAMSHAQPRPVVEHWDDVEQVLEWAWEDIVLWNHDVNAGLEWYAGQVERAAADEEPERLPY
jgi:trehalose transport system substrate-binding protein